VDPGVSVDGMVARQGYPARPPGSYAVRTICPAPILWVDPARRNEHDVAARRDQGGPWAIHR